MPRWWHDEAGRAWLDEIPALVAAQCARWDLDPDGPPMHGSNALVVPVRRRGERFVLRLAPPGDDVERESQGLRLWAGRGVVRLFDVEPHTRAMLLERLDNGRTLQSEPMSVAVPVIAALVRTMAVPVGEADIASTADIAAHHVDNFEAEWSAVDKPTSRRQLDVAIRMAVDRAAESDLDTAVDGDVHCQQVLASVRAPWLVVDPVMLRGDPEYDFARVLWDRLDEFSDDVDIAAAFDVFVSAADVPEDRARAWVILRSMSYLLWGISRGLTSDPPKCRRLLDVFC